MSSFTRGPYMVSTSGLAVTAATDFLQLRNGSTAIAEILEIRVFQTSDVALAMNAIQIQRGTGAGTGGTALTERSYDTSSATPVVAAASAATAFTAQVTSINLDLLVGWNVLQEMVWLPTPETQIILQASDNLSLSLLNADTLTIGCQVTWRELGT